MVLAGSVVNERPSVRPSRRRAPNRRPRLTEAFALELWRSKDLVVDLVSEPGILRSRSLRPGLLSPQLLDRTIPKRRIQRLNCLQPKVEYTRLGSHTGAGTATRFDVMQPAPVCASTFVGCASGDGRYGSDPMGGQPQ